jgi:ubiquinone biosynthesis protein COQ4
MATTFRDVWTVGKGIWAITDLFRHPDHLARIDDITDLIAVLFPHQLERLRVQFSSHSQGVKALRERRRLSCDTQALARLPLGTLGRTFADHMIKHDLDARDLTRSGDRIPAPNRPHGEEIQFIRRHIYYVHDVWHVICGFGADVNGELGLAGFSSAQTPYTMPNLLIAMGMFHTAVLAPEECEGRMSAISAGYQIGKRAKPLFGVNWEELWATPLDEVRRMFDVIPYQQTPAQLAA